MNKRYFLENLFKQWSLNVFKVCDLFLWLMFLFVQIHETFGISVFDFYCRNAFLKLNLQLSVLGEILWIFFLFFTYYKIKCRIWRWNSAAKIFPLSCMVELSVSQNVTFTNQVICNDVSIIFIFKFCMFVF